LCQNIILMKHFVIIFFVTVINLYGQQSAIVEYEYLYNPNLGKKSTDYITYKAITTVDKAAEYAKQHRYILKFNPNESYYYIDTGMKPDDLEDPMAYHLSKMMLGSGIFYQNAPKRYTLNQKESMHQLFLVKDTIKNDWTISYEKKFIGGFKCYKATKKCKCGKDIVAWFTPEIPVPFGPAGYGGAPGLILELTYFKHTYRMKNIKFLKTPIPITPPNKGKPITIEELKKLQWNRRMELMKRYKNH